MVMGSLAVLIIFPAVCQLVLKRRKPNNRNINPILGTKYNIGNNRESGVNSTTTTTTTNVNLSASTVPFLNKTSSNNKSCSNVKNNNVNLNNKNSSSSFNKNVVITCDSKGEKVKSDVNYGGGGGVGSEDLKVPLNNDGGESGLSGTEVNPKKRRNWIEYYLEFLNCKWFTVSKSKKITLYFLFLIFNLLDEAS